MSLAVGAFLTDSLQDLLYDWQARDDLVERKYGLETEWVSSLPTLFAAFVRTNFPVVVRRIGPADARTRRGNGVPALEEPL